MSGNKKNTGRFKKGQSGNPAGRPKKDKDLVKRCKDMTFKILDRFEQILEYGKDPDALRAGEIILAYAHGKPETMGKMEITGANGGAVTFQWTR